MRNPQQKQMHPESILAKAPALPGTTLKKQGEQWTLDESSHQSRLIDSVVLRNLIDFNGGKEFTQEMAEEAIGELREIWPDVEGLNANALRKLHRGLIRSAGEDNEVVKYRFLRGFVAEGLEQVKGIEDMNDQVALGAVTTRVIRTVKRILGPG